MTKKPRETAQEHALRQWAEARSREADREAMRALVGIGWAIIGVVGFYALVFGPWLLKTNGWWPW